MSQHLYLDGLTANHGRRSHASLRALRGTLRGPVAALALMVGIGAGTPPALTVAFGWVSLAITVLGPAAPASAACPYATSDRCPPPPHLTPVPVPPLPSQNATGAFYLIYYRAALEQAGNQMIQAYNTSGRPGTLSWSGPSPLQCGHACVEAPEPPDEYWAFDRAWGDINLHWEAGSWPFSVWKDFTIGTELDAVCDEWQTGLGRLKLTFFVWPSALAGDSSWAVELADFFGHNFTTDWLINAVNQQLGGDDSISTKDLGLCRSLGVFLDQPSGKGTFDTFVWDVPSPLVGRLPSTK